MYKLLEEQPVILYYMISEYDFTYKQFVKYCVSNKKSYIMFIKNSYDDYYYTPRTKIELLRAIKMWC